MQPVALHLHFRKLGAQIVQRHEPDESAAAGNAALRFDDFAAAGFDDEVKAFGMRAQQLDGLFQLGCRLRLDPAAKSQKVSVVLRRTGLGRQLA